MSMFTKNRKRAGGICSLLLSFPLASTPGLAAQHEHPQPAAPARQQPEKPAIKPPDTVMTLAELERRALAGNPTLRQAEAGLRAAAGRKVQAGLYPNPTLGAVGEELSGGPGNRSGQWGGYVEQRIPTAGKLRLDRQIAGKAEDQSRIQVDAQRQRVLNSVRALYYQALGEQAMMEVRARLVELAGRAVAVSRELANVGQADQPDVLAIEIEAQRISLALTQSRNGWERTWREIAAITGDPDLQPARLEGQLEDLPVINPEEVMARLEQSPEVRLAEAAAERAGLSAVRAAREKIPDLMLRGGMSYNRELQERPGLPSRSAGRQGFFDVGVEIPIFNRNQGGVAAARADTEKAQLEVTRTKLMLRNRLAAAYREYQDAAAAAGLYRGEMLPKAKQAYELYMASFRQMAASYPQVLIAQRNFFQLQEDYVAALITMQMRAVEIRGWLLTGGLEAPMSTP